MAHTDCFAYNESNDEKTQCCALIERICNNTYCNFYKQWDDCDKDTKQLITEQRDVFNRKDNNKKLK